MVMKREKRGDDLERGLFVLFPSILYIRNAFTIKVKSACNWCTISFDLFCDSTVDRLIGPQYS